MRNIRPGSLSSYPTALTRLGKRFIFRADDGKNGGEPWISDSTKKGTKQLKSINPGFSGSWPWGFVTFGKHVYFGASDGVEGYELWRTDGTSKRTQLFKKALGSDGICPFMSCI